MVARAVRQDAGMPLRGDTIIEAFELAVAKPGQGRERFIGGGLGLRERRAAPQVRGSSSRERATCQSSSKRLSGVTSLVAAVCALLESGR